MAENMPTNYHYFIMTLKCHYDILCQYYYDNSIIIIIITIIIIIVIFRDWLCVFEAVRTLPSPQTYMPTIRPIF